MEAETVKTRRTRAIVVVAGILAVIAAVVAIGLFIFVQRLSGPNEVTARFTPDDAQAYVSINLRPGVNQLRYARDVINRARTGDVSDLQDDMLDELEDDMDFHLLDDVTPWLGSYVSLAALDLDAARPEWVLMASVVDRDAAKDFIEDAVAYLEDELYSDFDDDRDGNLELWEADDADVAIGLTDDHLFIADSERTIEDMIENIESPPSNSLADNEAFRAARDALPSSRFMFIYLESDEISDALIGTAVPYGARGVFNAAGDIPEYMALSASFFADGIRIDAAWDSSSSSFDTDSQLRAHEALPENTVAMFSTTGVDSAWEEYLAYLGAIDPYMYHGLQEAQWEIEYATGVHIEDDVLDSLSGEISVALLPSEFNLNARSRRGFGVIEILFLAGVEDSDDIADALEDLADWMDDVGVDVDTDSLGDYELVTIDLRDTSLIEMNAEPGYVVTDDWVAVGSNVDGIEEFYNVATGRADSLDSNSEFGKLMGIAPKPVHSLLYVNLKSLIEAFEDTFDLRDDADYREYVEPFVEQLGSLMVTVSSGEEQTRASAALTILE